MLFCLYVIVVNMWVYNWVGYEVCIYKFLYLYLGPSDLQSLQVWVKWWPELEREVRQAIKPEMKSVYDSRYVCVHICMHTRVQVRAVKCLCGHLYGFSQSQACVWLQSMEVSIYFTSCTYIICIIFSSRVCVYLCAKALFFFLDFPSRVSSFAGPNVWW